MENDLDLEFQARYDALRGAYLDALPQRRADAAQHWRSCARHAQSPAWRELHTLAHRLSGSAPCYGMDEIGVAAQKLDRLLSGKPPCRETDKLAPLVERLLTALDAAMVVS